ncbi:Glutamine transport system permease protein GlnP [wastewater metagenome]|uniref:Glutamine transport system permease protein GlnP n=2 Tax=unclassified sequences TaxID=12908 RepID=A0A5B8RB26_9ZZZZ|nr:MULTISPECIES: glutamine ABC transporter permease GlnP [Arhodomonas]MCS4504157.1 glutamine ABC transporter permease GlnP [Arhodomonas aquaeolei]QEA03955.1 glutamine transport system permease protein GlnP [uncultured organism]
MQFDFSVIPQALPELFAGARLTLYITVVGLLGGFAIGVVAGTARAYGNRAVNAIAMAYIELIRGTPIVVQVMFIYFAMPILLDVRLDALTSAVSAIVINAGAYIAEIVRGALLSISRGYIEAGKALGITRWQLFRDIIGPLAFRRLVPPLGNQCIISLKDTSLFIVIGVAELTRQGQEVMASTFRAVEIWSTVAVLYLAMTLTMTLALRIIERRMKIL